MNAFRTVVPISEFPFKISHKSQILCLGSCFSEHIGNRFLDYKFPCLLNPFGIIYNPISICSAIDRLLLNKAIDVDELQQNNDLHFHWDFHGDYSDPDKETLAYKINSRIEQGNSFLKTTDVLIITLGTSYIFRLKENKRAVANCHKIPNDKFTRELLSQDEINNSLRSTIQKLNTNNPDLNILFTVSPVRHIRDGLVENQLSKAQLISASHKMISEFQNVHYFPSYELIMDDLRDYRFYKKDMIHVNEIAIDYVWQNVANTFFESKTTELIKKIEKVNRNLNHKALFPNTTQHQKFLHDTKSKIESLMSDHPNMDFATELAELVARISG